MRDGPDVGGLIERALIRSAASAGVTLEVLAARARPWASVTFAGARHSLTVRVDPGEVGQGWLSGLAQADLPVAGHLVADAVVGARREVGGGIEAEIELLSVEER